MVSVGWTDFFELWSQAPLWKQLTVPFAPVIFLFLLVIGDKILGKE
jgi:hypothetical protein